MRVTDLATLAIRYSAVLELGVVTPERGPEPPRSRKDYKRLARAKAELVGRCTRCCSPKPERKPRPGHKTCDPCIRTSSGWKASG